MTLFLKGISDMLRQQYRDRLFAVSKESVVEVAKTLVYTINSTPVYMHTYIATYIMIHSYALRMSIYMCRYLEENKSGMSSAVIGPENSNLTAEEGWIIHSSNLQ